MTGPVQSARPAAAQASEGPVVLATGGTGGHVFPAQALAAALTARGRAVVVVTDRRGAVFGDEVQTYRIRSATAADSLPRLTAAAFEIAVGSVSAWRLLRRLRPLAVVGFGGYPSLPTMLAATRLGLRTLLHEQNAVLGRVNRLLAGRVDRIATSFDKVAGIEPAAEAKTVRTGNPVRPAVTALRALPYPQPMSDQAIRVLVTGGSQGARVFSDVVPEAVGQLPPPLRARLRIVQQCRPEDLERTRAAYAELGVEPELASFFDDLPQRLADAQLVVARAGASTVAELTVLGRPAVLVPYPHATDDHQTANARALDDAGAAWLMPQDAFRPQALAVRLESILNLPETLGRMAAAAYALARPAAAEELADLVEAVATTPLLPAPSHHAGRLAA